MDNKEELEAPYKVINASLPHTGTAQAEVHSMSTTNTSASAIEAAKDIMGVFLFQDSTNFGYCSLLF